MAEVAHAQAGFFESVARTLLRYADFGGRATRAEFWWYALFYVLVLALCSVFNFAEFTPTVTVGSVLASIFTIVTLLFTLAVSVRQLRDAETGWRHIFWLLLPAFGVLTLCIYRARPALADEADEMGRLSV